MHDFKKLLQHMPIKHDEYHYTDNVCSLFLLPDGLMFGTDKLCNHVAMVTEILGKKVSTREFITLLANSKIIRLVTGGSPPVIYIDCVFDPTAKQITTMRDLVKYGKYDEILIETHPRIIPNSPSENQIRRLLGMRIVSFNSTSHSRAPDVPENRKV